MRLYQRDRSPTVIASEGGSSHSTPFTRLFHDFFDPIYWNCRNRLGDAAAAGCVAFSVDSRYLDESAARCARSGPPPGPGPSPF